MVVVLHIFGDSIAHTLGQDDELRYRRAKMQQKHVKSVYDYTCSFSALVASNTCSQNMCAAHDWLNLV